jgi:23S rRNA (guanosine2251-2'-O)-methyltransferase
MKPKKNVRRERSQTRRTTVKQVPKGKQRELDGTQVEGRQAVREMLIAQRRRVHEVLIADDIDNNAVIDDIIALAADQRVPLHRVARRDIERLARSEAPQGVIAKGAELPEADIADFVQAVGGKPFIVAIDGVTDPGNLGAILRSCDGAGVTGVILPKHRAVHITPTAAKSAAGAAEYVPMALVSGLPTALRQLKEAGVWIVGLHDAADKSVFELGSLAEEPICLVLGAEGTGLSRLVRERCDMLLSIPMRGALSSLNVSAAAALATYEVVRVRRSAS